MKKSTLIKHLRKYIKHPDRIDESVLDYWCYFIKKPSDLNRLITTIDEDILIWQCIKMQGELIQMMKAIGIWQKIDKLYNPDLIGIYHRPAFYDLNKARSKK